MFNSLCAQSLKALQDDNIADQYLFNYIFIDDADSLPHSFFDLCSQVTHKKIYISCDAFENITHKNTFLDKHDNFLLTNCYRTYPKTIMFPHAVAMGLFEQKKLF